MANQTLKGSRMKRREKQIIKSSGKYEVVEIEIHNEKTDDIIDTCYEVRNGHKFLTEFENEEEALQQLDYFVSLDGQDQDPGENT